MEYIKVILENLPEAVKGFTVCAFDRNDGIDCYTIFINSKLNVETQIETYNHEIEHINNKDFDCMVSANQLELVRHCV